MNNTKTSFTKSLRRFHNQHRRGIRLLRERTIGSFRALFMTLSLIGVTVGAPGAALAKTLPTGAQVVSGDIQLQQGGSALRVIQGSQAAIVNWQSFDIGHGALVDIVQPNVDAALLSRVVGENLSQIHGSLNANGHLYLINPNGILFGADSQVNVHALIASTLDLADSDFLSGNLAFDGNSEASVMNLGSINAEEFAALIGGDLENAGALTVSEGSAALLAGDATLEIGEAGGGKITLDLSGLIDGSSANSGIIDVSSDSGDGGQATILGGSVVTSGSIDASGLNGGGEVLIGGDYQGQNPNLSHAQNTVVSGSIEANAKTDGDGGKVIVWSDGSTDFSGSITAQGGDNSGNGGLVETSGKQIVLNGSVNTLAKNGLSGTYLIDPDDIEINTSSTKGGYSLITPSTIVTNLGGGNVVVSTATEVGDGVTTDGGDIEIKADITATTTNSLTLTATDQIRSDYGTAITLSGGGDLILNAGVGGIQTIGTVSADDVTTNSDGNQVFVGNLVVGGTFDFTASESGSVINVTNLSGGGTLNGSTNNGSVTIAANTGDLAIQSVDAGTGDLSLTSAAGAITDADTSSDASANLIAAQITLESANGIGASGSGDLDTTASTLVSSVTGSGNIFITDSAAVSVGATSTGSGDITIGTSDGILTVSGTVNSSSGNLALAGDDGVTHTATGDLSTGGSGTVSVVASAGDVTMVDGTTYTAAGGTVSVTGASNVALGQIVNASGASNVTATAGSITDVTSAEGIGNENISGTTLTLSSATGIGSAGAANDLDVAATTIVASDSGTGSIYLAETDGVAIGATSTTSGALSIVAGGAVTTSGNISASGGSLALTGVGLTNSNTITGDANGISLSAGTGTLTSTAGSITNGGSAGTISLAADTDIVLAGGAGSITAGAGDVTLKDSAGSITMALAGGSGTIAIADADLDEITTTGTIIVGDASSGAVTIGGAVSAPGSAGLQFGGSSVALDAGVTSTDASITFVPGVTVGAGVTVDSGSGAGDITFSSTLDGGQAVVLDAGSGGINLNGVVGATPLTSLATTGTTGAISIGQNITTTGGQTFTGPVTLSGSPTLTTTDTLVSFDGDVSGAGALTVASGTGGLTFGSTVGNAVNITSLDTTGTTGNITLTGNLDSDGTVLFNGPVLLAADATITTSDDLVTFSSTLNNAQNLVVTTGSGGVTFTGIVGGSTPLTSILTTGTTGTITLGANVNTTGAQDYVGPVSFNSDIALNVTGGTDSDDVSFGDTVTSTADSLDINVAGSGDVTFGDGSGTDTVSGINALTVDGNAITVNTPVSATSIVFQGANSSGDQLTIASGGSLSATGLVTIGAAHDTTEIETIGLSGNITSDSDSSGNENLQILSNSAGSAVATFATSGVVLNAGTGAISASNTDFAAGSNNPSFLSDGGVSWNALTATGGTLTLAPNTANTGLNLGTGGGAYNLND
ncbi:MAG: filamentous hemagglutinin N-terminal domain-containing protein, partial [Verrucomicrobiota bacterium]|nr:filamentous hemagglutinin N-terminal domain-containing protein [Verrucomicrobiota bacterium]